MRFAGRLLLASLVPATLLLASPAAGQATAQSTGPGRGRAHIEAREATDRARAASAEEQRLAAQRVTAATRLHETETEVAARATEVSDLAEQRAAAEGRLRAHAATLAPLLPLIERLALYPAETLLAVPAQPGDALRGLGVLRGLARQLEQEAQGLRAEQAALDERTRALNAALPALRQAQATQAEQAQALDAQLATAQALRQRMEEAGAEAHRRAAAEAAQAESLRGALATLEASRARAEAQARDDAARADRARHDQAAGEARRREAALARPAGPGPERGQMVAPVAGSVVRAWGEPTDAGPATGVSYRPAPQARVVSPCTGRVRFAGPFRSYGAVLIVDCGGGFAIVLAGLERLDSAAGAAVLAGEPVGTMPAWDATAPARAGARPALYVELRRDGTAVNPAPYMHGKS